MRKIEVGEIFKVTEVESVGTSRLGENISNTSTLPLYGSHNRGPEGYYRRGNHKITLGGCIKISPSAAIYIPTDFLNGSRGVTLHAKGDMTPEEYTYYTMLLQKETKRFKIHVRDVTVDRVSRLKIPKQAELPTWVREEPEVKKEVKKKVKKEEPKKVKEVERPKNPVKEKEKEVVRTTKEEIEKERVSKEIKEAAGTQTKINTKIIEHKQQKEVLEREKKKLQKEWEKIEDIKFRLELRELELDEKETEQKEKQKEIHQLERNIVGREIEIGQREKGLSAREEDVAKREKDVLEKER